MWLCAVVAVATSTAIAQSGPTIYAKDYPSINEAVNACPEGGCTLVIPAGVNTISSQVNLKGGMRVTGEPGAVIAPSNTFRVTDCLFKISGIRGVGVALTSAPLSDSRFLAVNDPSKFHANDAVVLTNAGQDAVELGLVSEVVSGGVNLACSLGAAMPATYSLYPVQQIENVSIDHLEFRNAPSWAIYVQYGKNITISDVSVHDSRLGVISVGTLGFGARRNTITNNGYGLRLLGNRRASITDNVVSRNLKACLALVRSDDCWIEGNQIEGVSTGWTFNVNGDGITVSASWRNQILRNTIRNISCYGIWVCSNSGFNTVRDNIVDNTYASGIQVLNSNGNVVETNQVSNLNRSAGISVVTSDSATLVGNTVTNCARSALLVGTTNCLVRGNSGAGNALGYYAPPSSNEGLVTIDSDTW